MQHMLHMCIHPGPVGVALLVIRQPAPTGADHLTNHPRITTGAQKMTEVNDIRPDEFHAGNRWTEDHELFVHIESKDGKEYIETNTFLGYGADHTTRHLLDLAHCLIEATNCVIALKDGEQRFIAIQSTRKD